MPTNVNLAALWIPVMPETSHMGEGMEKAGKEAQEGFAKGAKDFGKHIKEDIKKVSTESKDELSKLGESLKDSLKRAASSDTGKVVGKAVGKGIVDGLADADFTGAGVLRESILQAIHGDDIGTIVGTQIAKPLAKVLEDTGIGDGLNKMFTGFNAGNATEGLQGISDALEGINNLTNSSATNGIQNFVKDLQNVSGIGKSVGEGVTAFKDLSNATKAAIAPTLALDAAEDANPIGAVVVAIEACVAALAALVEGVMYAYNHWQWFHKAVDATWQMLKKVAGWLSREFVQAWHKLSDAVKTVWDKITQGWHKVYDNVLKPMGNFFKAAFDDVKKVVDDVIGWFEDKFSHLADVIKKPFDLAGGALSHLGIHVFGHAEGGPIYGSGPKGKDSILAMLAPGEHVVTADEVDRAGGHGNIYAARNLMRRGMFPAFETGGAVGATKAEQWARGQVGLPYSQARRNDCSGMVSQIVNVADGKPPRSSLMTTRNESSWLKERGFKSGTGPAGTLRIGWYNHGSGADDGHTALTFPDGTNAESGGRHHNFLMGSGAAGANSSMFDQHAWRAINPQGEASGGDGGDSGLGGSGGGGGGGSSSDSTGSGGGGGGGGGSSSGGGGDGGGGGRRIGGAGGGSDKGQKGPDTKQLGNILGQGFMEELGLDGSVFSAPGGSPLNWGVTKIGQGLIDGLGDRLKQTPAETNGGSGGIGYGNSDLGASGMGGGMGMGGGSPAEESMMMTRGDHGQPLIQQQVNVSPGATYSPNAFSVHGVGSVPEQQEQHNANMRRSTPVVHNAGGLPRK